jgi:hydrogenase small subunit
MPEMTRRQFLAWGAKLAALMGLETSAIPKVVEALEDLTSGEAPLLWLQGLSCSGCSVSLLNSEAPDPTEIITGYVSLVFHSTLSAATGEVAVDVINRTIEHGGYYLAVEGAIPAGMPRACMLGEEPITNQVLRAARNAKAVISVGACASFGGIPAAENNPTGALSVPTFLTDENVATPVIRVPGCPAHPDWIVGTLVHVLKFGLPELDALQRPTMFYGRMVHDQCPRFSDYERERFAKAFSDDGCLFKLGCLGPVTHADCALRFWNGRTNYCIKAGAPCIGCASEDFALRRSFPFYTKQASA